MAFFSLKLEANNVIDGDRSSFFFSLAMKNDR